MTVVKPFVAAALGQKPSRYPAWFMRQAGRYLPEYREVRAKVDFVTLCKSPALAAEVTLQPLRRYDLDAAIIFSDILIPCVAMGQNLSFDKGEGPVLSNAVRSAQDLKALHHPSASRDLGFVGEAIAKTKLGLRPDQAMIGFAGAPFTVASYMIEGQSSKNFTEVKKLMLRETSVFKDLLGLIAETTIDYLKMQIESGADAIMLFDTWAAQLTGPDYREHVFPVTKKVLSAIKSLGTPVIYFPGQGCDRMMDLEGIEVDVVSVDWRTRLTTAAAILQKLQLNVTLQGNLDPQHLICTEPVLREKVRGVIANAAQAGIRSHIFNVGHGLLPHTPPESLSWVLDELRKAPPIG